jgi:hypothetical protein
MKKCSLIRDLPEPTQAARAWPNWETNEARGRGFLHGAGRSKAWALMTSGLLKLTGGAALAREGQSGTSSALC